MRCSTSRRCAQVEAAARVWDTLAFAQTLAVTPLAFTFCLLFLNPDGTERSPSFCRGRSQRRGRRSGAGARPRRCLPASRRLAEPARAPRTHRPGALPGSGGIPWGEERRSRRAPPVTQRRRPGGSLAGPQAPAYATAALLTQFHCDPKSPWPSSGIPGGLPCHPPGTGPGRRPPTEGSRRQAGSWSPGRAQYSAG